jgi:hypothetical protein
MSASVSHGWRQGRGIQYTAEEAALPGDHADVFGRRPVGARCIAGGRIQKGADSHSRIALKLRLGNTRILEMLISFLVVSLATAIGLGIAAVIDDRRRMVPSQGGIIQASEAIRLQTEANTLISQLTDPECQFRMERAIS